AGVGEGDRHAVVAVGVQRPGHPQVDVRIVVGVARVQHAALEPDVGGVVDGRVGRLVEVPRVTGRGGDVVLAAGGVGVEDADLRWGHDADGPGRGAVGEVEPVVPGWVGVGG